MPITKSLVAVLPSTSCAAGSSKAAPGATSAWIDVRNYIGGTLSYTITNGASAPALAANLLFQVSGDNGTTITDYFLVAGDTVASSSQTGTYPLEPGVMYVRAIAFNNSVNAVTCAAALQAVTGI